MDETLEQVFTDTEATGNVTLFSDEVLAAIGRGFGTLARRRGDTQIVVSAAGPQSRRPTSSLTRALILSGHKVIVVEDGGRIGSVPHEAAVHVSVDDDKLTLSFYIAGAPLLGVGLQTLRSLAAAGRYCAGEGELLLV